MTSLVSVVPPLVDRRSHLGREIRIAEFRSSLQHAVSQQPKCLLKRNLDALFTIALAAIMPNFVSINARVVENDEL